MPAGAGGRSSASPLGGYNQHLGGTTVSNLRVTKLFIIVLNITFILVACSTSPSKPATAVPTTVKPTAYTVVLVCDDCAAIGMKINVWQKAGTSRGSVSFSVPHNTTVNVIDSKTADDGRRWYRVEYKGNIGWIPQDFARR